MVSALDSGSRDPGLSPAGSLCCVLGQDTLLSQCLSPPRSMNGYQRNAGGTCNGLASHPGEIAIFLVT